MANTKPAARLMQSTPGRYAHAIPFEVALGNTDFEDESSVSYLKRYYLESGEVARIPGYCSALLHGLACDTRGTSTTRINAMLSGLVTALSTLKTSGRIDVFEDAKDRVFRAKSLIGIAQDSSTTPLVEKSRWTGPLVSRMTSDKPSSYLGISHLVSLLNPASARDMTLVQPIVNSINEILAGAGDREMAKVGLPNHPLSSVTHI